MAQALKFDIEGVEEISNVLGNLTPKQANNLMRSTIHGVAGEIRDEAKKNIPIKTGNLRKAIKTRRRRSQPEKPISDVYFTQGKKARHDGFYWRFVEHGTGGRNPQPARPFVRPAKDKILRQLPRIMDKQFSKKLTAWYKRASKRVAANG